MDDQTSDFRHDPNETSVDRFQEDQKREVRSQRMLLITIRSVFILLMTAVAMLPFVSLVSPDRNPFTDIDYVGPLVAIVAFAALVVLLDVHTPNKRLSAVLSIYLGIVVGLVGAVAISVVIDLIADSWGVNSGDAALRYLTMLKLAMGITIVYLAVSIVLTTKDNFRLVIPYVEFAQRQRGTRPIVLDTSVLIDGRIEQFSSTGFLDAPLIVPQFIIEELHTLSDSADQLKRGKGRRGLGVLRSLQSNGRVDLSIDDSTIEGPNVDRRLMTFASERGARLATTDSNLLKVAQIEGTTTLNINELAMSLRGGQVIAGDTIDVAITRPGDGPDQGVGYMPDGTMIVVDGGASAVGETITVIVSNSLQTAAGRMVFAKREAGTSGADESNPGSIASTATTQPRHTSGPPDTKKRRPPGHRPPR